MIESQVLVWFFIGCAVIFVVARLVTAMDRNAVREAGQNESNPSYITLQDSTEFEEKSEELMSMVARSLGVRREKLTTDANFQHDLRVPLVELNALLDDIQDTYGIVINSESIMSVGDILDLIREENDRA